MNPNPKYTNVPVKWQMKSGFEAWMFRLLAIEIEMNETKLIETCYDDDDKYNACGWVAQSVIENWNGESI